MLVVLFGVIGVAEIPGNKLLTKITLLRTKLKNQFSGLGDREGY